VAYFHHYLLTLEPGEVPDGEHLVPFGQAAVRREGGDVTSVALGYMVGLALAAAERLAGEGVQAEVIDPRTLNPLDLKTILESVGKTGRLVLVDQATRHGSASAVIAAAVCGQLRDDDPVYSGHRAHGHAIAKGAPLDRVLAELMGRSGGLCRGLGGSMHLVDVEHGFMGATGVVGGNIPMALGSALAGRLRGDDSIAVVFFGDGAVQGGVFNETVNLAALWALPLVLVCENNGFAEFTPRSAHTNVERVVDVVAPYALERTTVDGSDATAVWDAFGAYLVEARQGRGPFLLECLTYRLRAHYEGDHRTGS